MMAGRLAGAALLAALPARRHAGYGQAATAVIGSDHRRPHEFDGPVGCDGTGRQPNMGGQGGHKGRPCGLMPMMCV